jgi:hypothetical protein
MLLHPPIILRHPEPFPITLVEKMEFSCTCRDPASPSGIIATPYLRFDIQVPGSEQPLRFMISGTRLARAHLSAISAIQEELAWLRSRGDADKFHEELYRQPMQPQWIEARHNGGESRWLAKYDDLTYVCSIMPFEETLAMRDQLNFYCKANGH